jgi:D-tyrosyl-tRNA(Tyr) deacylase
VAEERQAMRSKATLRASDERVAGLETPEGYIDPVRAVVQRVRRASVAVDGVSVGKITRGLLVLVCVAEGDGKEDAVSMAGKLARLRIFPDEHDRMNRSVTDIGGEVLVVSQFTLCADVGKGNRPSFTRAADPGRAEPILEAMVGLLRAEGLTVETGIFGGRMLVSLDNEGPVTLVVDVEEGSVV